MQVLYFKPDKGLINWSNRAELHNFLLGNDGKECYAKVGRVKGVRSLDQNAALHLWCRLVADELNESGQTLQKVLTKTIELNWTQELVKELLWRSVQIILIGKKSTTVLNKTDDINTVYEHLNRFLGEKCMIHVPFPSDEKIDESKIEYPENNLEPIF